MSACSWACSCRAPPTHVVSLYALHLLNSGLSTSFFTVFLPLSLSLAYVLFVLLHTFPHTLSFFMYASLSKSNLHWLQILALNSLISAGPAHFPTFLQRDLLKSNPKCCCVSVLVQPSLSLMWVSLVTRCSDTHLLVSYNNGLPHTVHPLCSCPALILHTKVLSPTLILIRRLMDVSHNNRPVTVHVLSSPLSVSTRFIRFSATFMPATNPGYT